MDSYDMHMYCMSDSENVSDSDNQCDTDSGEMEMRHMSDNQYDMISVTNTDYTYWQMHCNLCTVNGHTGKHTRHRPWYCRKYFTPQKVRKRLLDIDRCTACGIDRWAHGKRCDVIYIAQNNYNIDWYPECPRCGELDAHVHWTCDNMPHPGSQFNKSLEGTTSRKSNSHGNSELKLTNVRQNPTASERATKSEDPALEKKEKIIETRQINVNEAESSIISNKTVVNSEYEISNIMKKEFETIQSKIIAMHSDLNDKLAVLKPTKGKDESSETECSILDKRKEQDIIIKDQKQEIQDLKFRFGMQDDYWSEQTVDLYSQIEKMKKELKEKSVNYNILETLRKRIETLKEKNKKHDTEKNNFMEQHQKESGKFMNLLSIIFPNIKIDKNLDNISFIETLESRVKNSGCESVACQRKIHETVKDRNLEISTLKKDLSQLEAQLTVSESNLLNSQGNLNAQAQFETLKHEINHNNEIIHQKNNTIETLQSQLECLRNEFLKRENSRLQEVNQNMSKEEKSENKDSRDIEENKLKCDSKIASSNIEKILLEISNEKRIAREQRKNINDKMEKLSTDSVRYIKRKLIKYRGERGSQIASFEERIKRDVNNILSRTNEEEIRFLENKHKHDKQDIIQKIKKLEEIQERNHREMTEKFNALKNDNEGLKQKLNEKQKDISKLGKLLKDPAKCGKPKINYKKRGEFQKSKIRNTKKFYKRSSKNTKINQMINSPLSIKEKKSRDVPNNHEEHNSVTQEASYGSHLEVIDNAIVSNINNKEIPMSAQNDPKYSEFQKVKNIEISHEANKMDNYDKLCLVEDNDETQWQVLSSKNSKSCNISKISPKLSKVLNQEKADSLINVLTESFRFSIEMEDKILLYNKDPRLRINLGNVIRKSNKFGCLRNNFLYEREI